MNTTSVSMVALVRAAAIEPKSCRPVSFALAAIHDGNSGHVEVSMRNLAAAVQMSKAQTRKHVHALVALGVLEVTANAHGGAPGTAPVYCFKLGRLQALATGPGRTTDIFDAVEQRRPTYRFVSEGRARMVAQLAGRPGQRCVQFFRESDGGLQDYGQVPLSQLLLPWRLKGCWDAVLYQVTTEEDNSPEEIFPGEFEMLQQWAQQAALGRVESVVEA